MKLKKWLPTITILLFALGLILILSSFLTARPVKRTEYIMGTLFEITAYGRNSDQAIEQAYERIHQIDRVSSNSPGSDIHRINKSAGVSPVKVSKDVWIIINEAIKIWRLTDGSFDVTVGPLVKAWGFSYEGNGRIPDTDEINRVKSLVDSGGILLDSSKHSIMLARKGMEMDLSAIAKGYAVDQAIAVLKKHGITKAMVNGGNSSISVIGRGPSSPKWRIGISNPRDESEILKVLSISEGQSIGTSSDDERFFTAEGKRFSHIIDPKTGEPARASALVTITAPSAMMADALSTAVFVLGPQKGLKLLNKLKNVDGLIVDPALNVFSEDYYTEEED